MESLISVERSVKQVNTFDFTTLSLCYWFYFSIGFFCLFYKRIVALLSNEYGEDLPQV